MSWKVIVGVALVGAWLYVGFFRPDIQALVQGIGVLGITIVPLVALVLFAVAASIRWLQSERAEHSATLDHPIYRAGRKKTHFNDVIIYLAIATAVFFYLGLHHIVYAMYENAFGLSANSSVSDYLNAPDRKTLKFQRNLCGDIPCYTRLDFICGFSVGRSEEQYVEFREALNECFWERLRHSNPSDRLGEIVMVCGRENMFFNPAPSDLVSPENCEANGGTWGVPTMHGF